MAEDIAAAVELDGLTRNYGERAALLDITLTLGAGETLVVFGPNGAGKTTLLRVLATLLRPHSGNVRVLGGKLPDDAWRVRGRVGLLGHEPLLYRELTARENLRYHASLHGVDEGRIEELLDTVRMAGRADEPVRTLSRGMVQRVAVARATLHDPELLLLDEPYANLDPAAIELVEPLIGAGSGRTRVLTSHDPGRDAGGGRRRARAARRARGPAGGHRQRWAPTPSRSCTGERTDKFGEDGAACGSVPGRTCTARPTGACAGRDRRARRVACTSRWTCTCTGPNDKGRPRAAAQGAARRAAHAGVRAWHGAVRGDDVRRVPLRAATRTR